MELLSKSAKLNLRLIRLFVESSDCAVADIWRDMLDDDDDSIEDYRIEAAYATDIDNDHQSAVDLAKALPNIFRL